MNIATLNASSQISTLPSQLKNHRYWRKTKYRCGIKGSHVCLIYMFEYLMNFPCRPVFLPTLFCTPIGREFIYCLFPFLFILRNYVALLSSLCQSKLRHLHKITPEHKFNLETLPYLKTAVNRCYCSTFRVHLYFVLRCCQHSFTLRTFWSRKRPPTNRCLCIPTSLPSPD
jgi:hypothetical protein